ncbi:MAG: hypothetical protein ACR2KK_19235 [Acidimicrobiales bacterium]
MTSSRVSWSWRTCPGPWPTSTHGGAIKLVADAGSGKVLGVHAVAEGAGDLILAGVYAIQFNLTVDDLANAWAPYLTMSEGLKLVAQSFKGDVKKLSCCAA